MARKLARFAVQNEHSLKATQSYFDELLGVLGLVATNECEKQFDLENDIVERTCKMLKDGFIKLVMSSKLD